MMRSLYSAVSGLKNHQIKMDVIGNNIANVNTTGFKKSRTTFATALSQTLQGASVSTATSGGNGGTNPIQVGLGASLSSIDQMMTQGSASSTGVGTDLMINGPGFFALQQGSQTVYSRAGAFHKDSDNYLVDAAGSKVLDDTGTPIQITAGTASFTIDSMGAITEVDSAGTSSTNPQYIQLATFPNDTGLLSIGGSYYLPSNNSGTINIFGGTTTNYPSGTTLSSGNLEMSNVDLSSEFTDMIIAQRGFQANSRVITVSDSLLEELINLKRS
ncbi:flagellar hook-basal body complex protein [Desulfosporosinus sp. BG]|uniref:flagellar hook-basal body complex protein n=1 Tax=Desulfosporosinus sp. BG TaxID=1633135 RepID=UPI00083AA2FB|nr:flagellar hook-basal body complex protein [Desulfosporosinus sp. BG]ODA42496.1 Flagellar hook protein FlgE [Desulfosporosinus sp. BG]